MLECNRSGGSVRDVQPPSPTAVVAGSVSQLAAARARLATTVDLPLAEQVSAYDEVHRLLQDALAGVQQVLQAAPPVTSGS